MTQQSVKRFVPQLPPAGRPMRLLIDTDIANEIDDVYAVALALRAPERFKIEGFVATHFAAKAGPESIDQSLAVLHELLAAAGCAGHYPVARSAHPMRYPMHAEPGEGPDLIIERAMAGDAGDPLWVLVLGAATNTASAILKQPAILPRVRVIFHARNEMNWPTHTEQFNVLGDIRAAQALLAAPVPLVWFDTGTHLTCTMELSESRLAPHGPLGRFLHEFRYRKDWFQRPDKGFYDLADVAWMLDPSVAQEQVIPAPRLTNTLRFRHDSAVGQMRRVCDIDRHRPWEMPFERIS